MRHDSGDSTSNRSMTDWSMVLDAGQVESPTQAASLDELVRKYWTPLYAFVRASGQSPEDTHDIVQGFIADVLLSRSLLAKADPERGRFRNLLFRSISNYMRDRHRKATSTMRKPRNGGVRSLDETESFFQAVDRDLNGVWERRPGCFRLASEPPSQIRIGITTARVFSSSGGVIRDGESSSWNAKRISFIWIALIASIRYFALNPIVSSSPA